MYNDSYYWHALISTVLGVSPRGDSAQRKDTVVTRVSLSYLCPSQSGAVSFRAVVGQGLAVGQTVSLDSVRAGAAQMPVHIAGDGGDLLSMPLLPFR